MPKVSIIVPSYNHAGYLAQRLESIYGQTYRDCEVILLDDRSSDGSREILESFPKTLPTRCVFNETNSGSPFTQWIKGIGLAQGELVWIAESDDVSQPAFLETLVRELDADPAVSLAFCQSRVLDRDGRVSGIYTEVVNRKHTARYRAGFRNRGTDECARFLIRENLIPNASAVVFRRSLAAGIEAELAATRYMGDWLLYLHLLTQGDLCFVAEPLNSYRIHPANQSHSAGALSASFQERLRGVKWLSRRIALPRESLRAACDELLAHWFFVYRCQPGSSWGKAFRQLRNLHREGGLPWGVLAGGLFRFAGRRLADRLKRALPRTP